MKGSLMDNYDVIVIGYGPVGQMASVLLGQAGHKVISVERHAQMYGLSRAGHIDDEIMRLLDRVGAGEEFRKDAVEWELYDMRNKAFGGDLLMSMDWSVIGSHGYRSHWIFYQNNLELALNRQVQATGNVEINFSTELIRFDQDADGVTAIVRHRESGEERTIRAKYLLAADGANSFVRSSLGIEAVEGHVGPNQLVIDTLQKRPLTFEFDNGQFADPELPGCLFQLGKQHRRWEFTLGEDENPEDYTIDTVWERLKPWVGPEDVEVLRWPIYRFRESMTQEWRRERIFLIGDAAHTLWPFAGEGMCNGLRDAATITWRLDLVLRGLASPAVFDTYQDDRQPNMQGWTDYSREIGLPCIVMDKEAAASRDQFLFAVQQDPSIMPPATVPPGPTAFSRQGDSTAGLTAVQGQIRSATAQGLLDDVAGRGFQLITNRQGVADALTDTDRETLARIGASIIVIGAPGSGAPYEDIEGTYAAWFDSLGRVAVLARPDYYLFGSAEDAADVHALVDSLSSALGVTVST